MNQAEIEQIKIVLKAYKVKKDEILAPLHQYWNDVKEGKQPPYFEDEIIFEVYSELDSCFERKQFNKLATLANGNPEFERFFSAVHAEIFLNRPMNPIEF